MKIRINPIIKKDLQVTARSMRLSWGLFAYEVVLTLAFLLALAIIQADNNSYYSSNNIYSYLIYLFPVQAVVQAFIVVLIVPIITAPAISGEKERQTFDMYVTVFYCSGKSDFRSDSNSFFCRCWNANYGIGLCDRWFGME